MKYKIGFWNYVKFGVIDIISAVKDWEELGINLAMSFEYDGDKNSKEDMILLLDECYNRNIKVIVCDKRTCFLNYIDNGAKAYQKDVEKAVAEFGNHPAVYGFHIGDEPNKNQWDSAIESYIICRDAASHLIPFMNLLPYFLDGFEETVGVERDRYFEKLEEFMVRTKAKVLSYDCYCQCAFFDREKWLEVYFRNLEIFSSVAKKFGAELFTSLLSVGHWSYRVPTEDDLRWQISTAISHGVDGIMWFFIYERDLDGSYRNSPIDLFWKRTDMFDKLSRQNNTFNKYFAPLLEGYDFDRVEHYYTPYANFPDFKGKGVLKSIKTVINYTTFAVAYFKKGEKEAVVLVNMSQTEPSCICPEFVGKFSKYNVNRWFAPGMMTVYTEEGCI